MIRILLLDCGYQLLERLKNQGFDVESGTIGFQTGARQLPSQLYEKQIIVYSPTYLAVTNDGPIQPKDIKEFTPEFNLEYLSATVEAGATLLIFVNSWASSLCSSLGSKT
jgi:uroporphyrinogen-III decarboxylase